jgi:hypothetical protein
MKSTRRLFAIALVSVWSTAFICAAETKISKSDLPAAVQKTAQEQSKGATVKGYIQVKENGQVECEVEMMLNGHSRDVTIAPDGHVLEVEEQIEMDAVSKSVQSGLESEAGKGKITKIESLTKRGAIVAYEAQVVTLGKHSEIQVGPDGQKFDHEE